jgi:hypothetical protein
MWTCLKCGEEIDNGFDLCWGCGTSADGVEDPGFCPEVDGVVTAEDFVTMQAARAHETLVTVATFADPCLAYVAQARLQAEGVIVYLADEQSVAVLLSNAVGGVKLQVAERDAARAVEVLSSRRGRPFTEEDAE